MHIVQAIDQFVGILLLDDVDAVPKNHALVCSVFGPHRLSGLPETILEEDLSWFHASRSRYR